MSDAGWYSIGRALAFVYAAGWFVGTWIFTLVSFAIISPQPPDAADRAAHYRPQRSAYEGREPPVQTSTVTPAAL